MSVEWTGRNGKEREGSGTGRERVDGIEPPCIRARCGGRVCVHVSTLRFTAAPLTVAYGRQRDARVAYVHNTVHRYRAKAGWCEYRLACARACACAYVPVAFDAASRTVQRPASRIEIARSKR